MKKLLVFLLIFVSCGGNELSEETIMVPETTTTTTTTPVPEATTTTGLPGYNRYLGPLWVQVTDQCSDDPMSPECPFPYDPISEFNWNVGSAFWVNQVRKLYGWSWLYTNPGKDQPEFRYGKSPKELGDIYDSAAFLIQDNDGNEYYCYLVSASSMYPISWIPGIYPMPLEIHNEIRFGEQNKKEVELYGSGEDFMDYGLHITEPMRMWDCYISTAPGVGRTKGENFDVYSTDIYGAGVPLLRGNFGNHIPDARYADWTMWGPPFGQIERGPFWTTLAEEYMITELFWWYEDGFSIEQLCSKGVDAFTYQEDYEWVCIDE